MARTSIVTDSSSGLDIDEVRPLGIAIIPMHIEIGGRTYREGKDLSLSEFHTLVNGNATDAHISPPSVRDFHELFRQLGRESDQVVAILTSSHLNGTINVARQAAQSFMGRARVTVLDSRLTATPLGWLAMAAGEAASAGVDSLEIIRLMRAMIPHMYLAFFAESLEYVSGALTRPAPALAAAATSTTKPLLMIEEGEIMPLERSRSRGRAVERLFEFVTEFAHLERVTILQGKPMPEALELATLISEELPDQPVETAPFAASLVAQLGADALGVAVYEGMG